MSKILLAFLAVAAMLSSPILLIMDQLYVAAGLGVAGIVLATGLLVTVGEKKND